LTGDEPIFDIVNRFVTLNCIVSARRITKKGVGGLVLANGSNAIPEGLIVISAGEVRSTAVGAIPNGINIIFDGAYASTTFLQINNTASVGFVGGQIIVTAGAYGMIFPSTGNSHSYASAKSGSNSSILAVTDGNGGAAITIVDASLFTGILRVGSGSSSTPIFALGNLLDGIGYGNLQFTGNVASTATFSIFGSLAPLVINNRQLEVTLGSTVTNVPTLSNNNASASNTIVVNTNLIVLKTQTLSFRLGGTNTGVNEFNGLIANGASSAVSFTKVEAGTWKLGHTANTYTGVTTLSSGILIVSNMTDAAVPSCIGAASSTADTNLIFIGGEFRYTGAGHTTNRLFRISGNFRLSANGSGPLVFSNTGQLGTNDSSAKTITVDGTSTDANTIACSFVVVSAVLSLTKVGIGRWVLTNSNNTSISGTVLVTTGILEITTSTSIDSGVLDTTGAGTLRLTGLTAVQLGGLRGAVNLANKIEAAGYSAITALTLNTITGKNVTYSGIISDGATGMTLTKTGAGTQALSGANTYTGETIINQGILSTNSDSHLGAGGAQVRCAGTSTWYMGANVTIYNRPLVIDNGFTLTLTSGNSAKTVTGVLSGNGTLFANHSTTFEFTNAANTFTGPITSATADNTGYGLGFASIGDSSEIITLTGATGTFRWLSASGATTTLANRPFRITNAGQVTISALGTTAASNLIIQQALLIVNSGAKTLRLAGTNTGLNTFAGVIADGAGSVVAVLKVEVGLWVLAGVNTFTGVLTIQAGTLRLTNLNAASTASSVNMNSASCFLEFGTDTAFTSFRTMTTASAANTYTLVSDRATNGAALNHSIGAFNFGATNATHGFTAGSHVTSGNAGITLPQVTLSGGAAGTAIFTPTTAFVSIGTVTGNAVTKTMQLDGTNLLNTITGAIANGSAVVSITKVNTSTWTLSGTNTYTGTTNISAGILKFDTANSLGGGGLLISGTGKANLNYVGTRNISALTLGGVAQASGSYGATGSGATFINDTYFLGTGTVTVP
jgi:autotransporter-associated beta strand protein